MIRSRYISAVQGLLAGPLRHGLTALICCILALASLSEVRAAVTVTTATGGSAVPSNTANGCSASGTWTSLTNPRIAEGNAGDIGVGNIVITAPSGFEFNTAAAVTILVGGSATATNNINNIPRNTSVAVTAISASQITFAVTEASTVANTLTWQGIQVRPTSSSPISSGNLTHTGTSTIAGMSSSTNLGTLTGSFTSPICRMIEFNSSGGTTSTNGLHFYIEDTTHIQVRRLNNTGQVYSSGAIPPSTLLDNGVFLRANNVVYGPSHTVSTFTIPTYNTYSLSAATPANPTTPGIQQTALHTFGLNAGPQVSITWKYTTPLDFLTAEVSLTIPGGYTVSAANPVRYYHVFDTYLGGSDSGCGVKFNDTNGKLVVGTYPTSTSTCASSTSLPAGVTIVESFRERSSPVFPYYCTATWSDFYAASSTSNCSILQAASLSNFIANTYRDTGIGIEYEFTSAGTYTFSYDFVIGTTVVPPYDHLEIQHDGSGTLCPETMKVLACTSSTVPCPIGNYVNTGTLTGTLTTSPTTPTVTWSPSANFTLGTSASSVDITFQGSSPGATYSLSATSLSSVPLNGIKCWNTATSAQSCSFTVANTACSVDAANFNVVDGNYADKGYNSATDHRIYTKLAGWNESTSAAGNSTFSLDVVALNAGGSTETAYVGAGGSNKNVKLEIIDDSAGTSCLTSATACAGCSKTVLATINPVTFSSTNSGYVNDVSVSLGDTKAYRRLIARVTDTNASPTVYGCSTDAFAVRPRTLTVTAATSGGTALTASGSGASGTPTVKAGTNFTINADSATVGYDGTPAISATKVTDFVSSTTSAPLSGSFSAADSATGKATGTTFKYNEVGYFVFAADAVYDASFVDANAADATNGDCVANSSANTKTGGKYGCLVGSAASSWGRFIPDHFVLSAASVTPAGSTFSYMEQPFGIGFTLTAVNASGGTTTNYAGSYAKVDATSTAAWPSTTLGSTGFGLGGKDGTTDLSARLSLVGTPTGTWTSGVATIAANIKLARPTSSTPDATWGPYDALDIGVAPQDSDGVALLAAALDLDASPPAGAERKKLTSTPTKVRLGRLREVPGQGSELNSYKMLVETQYWNGAAWITNILDNSTSFATANVGISWTGTGAAPTATAVAAVKAGFGSITLGKPGSRGTATICLDLASTANGCTGASAAASLSHLLGNWGSTSFNKDPSAAVEFGRTVPTTRGNWGYIYRRENY